MLEPTAGPELAPLVPAAPVPVPRVRVGSHVDAKALRSKLQALLAGLEEAGDRLGTLLAVARERAIHTMLQGPDGAYFVDFTHFATTAPPWGLGMSEALLAALARERRDPRRQARLTLAGPLLLQTRSAPRKGRTQQGVRGLDYSLQRLKRDRPDLLQQVADGTLPSIQAAAELAGHRPAFTGVLIEPMALARVIVSRLEPPQQQEVIRLVQHPQEIVDPAHGKNPHWDSYRARTTPPAELARQRAEAAAAKAAQREAYQVAYRQQRKAARAARRAAGAAA